MNKKGFIKLTIYVIVMVLLGYLVYTNKELILNKIDYIYRKYIQVNIKQDLTSNEYQKKENYEYVKFNDDIKMKNKEDIKNAIYTYLDAGWDKYIVVCDVDYLQCTSDVKEMVENKSFLTTINYFVNPLNTFNEFDTAISQGGKITFSKKRRYSEDKAMEITKTVDKIYKENYDSSKNAKENIKIFHDYIINNTRYDKENLTGAPNIESSTAYGVLKSGLGTCSGYSDTMSLFLDKMNIKNYRILSKSHVWNFVYVEGEWLHLDLTWDDPTSEDNTDRLTDKYFLISTEELEQKNDGEHDFDKNIYIEAK